MALCAYKEKPGIPAIFEFGSFPRIGDAMPVGHPHAGWIYAGISETTQRAFYAAPADSGMFSWDDAVAFAVREGARLPTTEELNQLYHSRHEGAFRGAFTEMRLAATNWYWSSSQYLGFVWAMAFSAGFQDISSKDTFSSLRCVGG